MDADALQRTLDAIDAVTTCGWCGTTLTANAPSPNYCTEEHQECWFADQADAGVLDAGAHPDPDELADTFLEAARIWNDPMPLGALFDEFLTRQFSQHTLFTSTTPDQVPLSYRALIERRLSYGVGLGLEDPRALLRNINIA